VCDSTDSVIGCLEITTTNIFLTKKKLNLIDACGKINLKTLI
jgi:hypothetical protein